MLFASRASARVLDTSRAHTRLRDWISKHATLPWKAAAHTWPPSTTGRPATSAMRSSSVAPRGCVTAASQVSLPSSMSSAMSLPLG